VQQGAVAVPHAVRGSVDGRSPGSQPRRGVAAAQRRHRAVKGGGHGGGAVEVAEGDGVGRGNHCVAAVCQPLKQQGVGEVGHGGHKGAAEEVHQALGPPPLRRRHVRRPALHLQAAAAAAAAGIGGVCNAGFGRAAADVLYFATVRL
jgi:hypothetical protein